MASTHKNFSPDTDYINTRLRHKNDFSCCNVTDFEIYKYFTHIDNIAIINDIQNTNGNSINTNSLLRNLYFWLPCPVKTQLFCKNNIESTFRYKLTRKHTKNATDKWVTCSNTEYQCKKVMKAVINMEVQSTAYYLRLLVNSIIYNNNNSKAKLILNIIKNTDKITDKITGAWWRDKNIFIIDEIKTGGEVVSGITSTAHLSDGSIGNNGNDNTSGTGNNAGDTNNVNVGGGDGELMPKKGNITFTSSQLQHIKPRLIMGFGPSASNKPHLINDMIKIFKQADPTFPDKFISIDDKLIRKVSMVYNIILTCIDDYNNQEQVKTNSTKKIKGFKNLINNIKNGEHALFPSTEIKENFATYLLTNYRGNVSLYVAATLCKKQSTMQVDVEPYVNITGDTNWNGLLIWQHQNPDLCTFDDDYKCNNNISNPFATDQDYRNKCNQRKQNEEYAVQQQLLQNKIFMTSITKHSKKPIQLNEIKAEKLRELRKEYQLHESQESQKSSKYREDCEKNAFSLLREQYENAMFTVKDWYMSMHNGKHFLHKAPGYRLKIHSASNTDTDTTKSIIKDYTKHANTTLQQKFTNAVNLYKSLIYCYNDTDTDTDENDYDTSNKVKKCTHKCDKYYKTCKSTIINSSAGEAVSLADDVTLY
jgi:hypothetical protein